ncbi:putative methyltransferase PMT2 [Apostasia shenzhenica]|uniref:Methyltransferase n=1 Tax=Apostasia shenzhenica TaxID=1088818 RepID=A0A2I0ABX3_9ASPA|nr:putative methyltransferase PMT2 [Apostasia shenzhenica]
MMGSKLNSVKFRTRKSMKIIIVVGLCCFFYVLGAWQRSGVGRGDSIALKITRETECGILPNLNFETHHSNDATIQSSKVKTYKPCSAQYSDYTPCQDQNQAMKFPRENMEYRERHCPPTKEKLRCLIPLPKGYVVPFAWPKSRDYVPYANVPYKSLTIEKAVQNWVQLEGNLFKFPGGGTMFPQGADAYIDELASVIPIADGTVRTALDTGCGVASWGAYLFKQNVLTMSFAPRDSHEAQVQFALERGVPAVIGVLGTIKLPYPSRAFDMVHCSRCLIEWTLNDGMYMMEVDRVLRPGGYWLLSGPPINWRTYYKTWKRSKVDLQKEQKRIEELAKLLCWEKKYEKGDIAIWKKKINDGSCQRERNSSIKMCNVASADDVWYKKMQVCINPFPSVKSLNEIAGGKLKKFPDRLYAVPPRVSSGSVPGITSESYEEDNKLWKKHVNAYRKMNRLLSYGRYRNILDMNAGLGGFAAALESSDSNSWVMNVAPTIAKKNTLGIIYERGLIGIYHDWCEVFSTYPRSYDLIHASGVLSLYQNKCEMDDILLEMDRILRPEGTVIFRDSVDVVIKVRKLASGMRWKTRMLDHEDGPLVAEKILIAVKTYWVVDSKNSTMYSNGKSV